MQARLVINGAIEHLPRAIISDGKRYPKDALERMVEAGVSILPSARRVTGEELGDIQLLPFDTAPLPDPPPGKEIMEINEQVFGGKIVRRVPVFRDKPKEMTEAELTAAWDAIEESRLTQQRITAVQTLLGIPVSAETVHKVAGVKDNRKPSNPQQK